MINLTGKSVFVKTQEEYLSVLKMAKLHGFTWVRKNHLNPIEIPLPNILMLSRLVDTFFSRTSWTMLLYAENHSISVA